MKKIVGRFIIRYLSNNSFEISQNNSFFELILNNNIYNNLWDN